MCMRTILHFVSVWTILTGISNSETIRVHVPNLPIFNGSQANEGLLPTLLAHLKLNSDKFLIETCSSFQDHWDIEALDCLRKSKPNELSLFRYDTGALQRMNLYAEKLALSEMLIMTKSWFRMKPVLLITAQETYKDSIFAYKDSSFLEAMYFLYVFHSSVWSLLLLYILVAGSLLFVFEYTHPFKLGFHKTVGQCEGRLTLIESYLYVTYAMFLRSLYKSPKSWAGLVLSIFWHAFCVLCIIAYVFGTSMLIFVNYKTNDIYMDASVNTDTNILQCCLDKDWCNEFAEISNYSIIWINPFVENFNKTLPIITDQLTAHYIQERTKYMVPAKLTCTDELQRFTNAAHSMSFLTTDPRSALSMNILIQQLEDNGTITELEEQWLYYYYYTNKNPSENAVCSNGLKQINPVTSPIRMKQMNGPFVFMITGGLIAIAVHLIEFVYFSFLKKDNQVSREDKRKFGEMKHSDLSRLVS